MKSLLISKKKNLCPDESGASLVELAISLPLLIFFVSIATDYALERYAESQLQTATVAAAEYAVNLGCDATGIRTAANNAVSSSSRLLFHNLTVSSSAFCACGADSGSLNNPVGTDAPRCGAANDVCASGLSAAAYVRITLSATYTAFTPIFLPQNVVTMGNKVVVRTSGSTSDCSG